MSSIVVNGDTSGSVTLSAPATAGTVTVTLPSASGTMAVSGGSTSFTDLAYTGTLTGGTGVVNLGSGQVYKDASGNVGIGTSSPSQKLHVQGATGFTAAEISDSYLSSNRCFMGWHTSDGFRITVLPSKPLVFLTNDTERARIDSSGNLLVGTTSVDQAGSKIQLSSSQNRVFTIQNTANVNGDQALWVNLGSNCNTTASPHIVCLTGTTNRLIVWGNGNVVNTNNSYGALSDIKLKENIVDASPKLDKLNQVRVVNFNLIGEEQKQIGVIAQELEQLFPSMIDETPDRDAEGIDLGTTTKSVKYSVFVPMLIKAIQEQQTLITALTARITALEGA